MDPVSAIHNAARHYCIERAAQFRRQYGELQATKGERISSTSGEWSYSPEALDVFPRYLLLEALQNDIESYTPQNFSTVDALREFLRIAATSATSDPLRNKRGTIAEVAIDVERSRFAEWAGTVSPEDCMRLPPLPYVRVLSEAERKQKVAAFAAAWGAWYGGYVTPSTGVRPTLTLHTHAMRHHNSYETLRSALRTHCSLPVFELREWGPSHELDLSSADFVYTGAEGFWTDSSEAWMVYASHESSITFGGEFLIQAMENALPDWRRFIYKGYALELYDIPAEDYGLTPANAPPPT